MARYLSFLAVYLCLTTRVFAQTPDVDFGFSYALLPAGNQTSISASGNVTFPDASVNLANPVHTQTNSVRFVITNRRQTSGTVSNIVLAGGGFRVSGVPSLSATIGPNATLAFNIDFQPLQVGVAGATLRIDFLGYSSSANSVSFILVGNGVGPVLVHEFIVGSATRTVVANETLLFPQTNIGDRMTAIMRVRNTGNLDAAINVLASSTASFALENAPFVPFTLPAGNSITFNITFVPTQAGTLTGLLRIGEGSFNLSGVAVGGVLTYTAVVGSASAALGPSASVIFTPAQVGYVSSALVSIGNAGNTAAFVNSISVSGPATGVFAITNLPPLPLRVESGATISFGLAFAPVAIGPAAGTLRIDNQTFNISGVGDPPPQLSRVSFTGAGQVVDAAQQIGIGVALDNPYPVQLTGKLTLIFAPTADVFSDDPAIAFASGGRTVNFVVPANSREAVFGLNDSRIRFQTGTVAGTITLAATFATDAGGINLTAAGAPATSISVRPSAPRIISVQLANRTTSSITVLITGYSSTRSLDSMDFAFTPVVDSGNKDSKLDTTTISLPVQGPFSVWFQSVASQPFGSVFTATITFIVHGDVTVIQALAVTMSNNQGKSNSGSVSLR